MSKWLITGSEGFIGSYLCSYLSKKHTVLGTFIKKCRESTTFDIRPMDIFNKKQVFSVLSQFSPDCVVHLAGSKDVAWCENNPELAFQLNVEGLANIAQACKEKSVFLIFMSSDYVFDGKLGNYSPSSPCHPTTIYGKTKLEAENVLSTMAFPHAIVRTGGVYSGTNPEGSFLGWAYRNLKESQAILAYENLFNSPTFIGDLLNAINILGEEKKSGIFHLGGATRKSRYSFLRLFAREFGFSVLLVKAKRYTPEKGVRRPIDISLNSTSSYKKIGVRFLDAAHGLRMAKKLYGK